MPRLSSVPDVLPRAIGYVRVSRERDDMISPELQRTAIADHCARSGYVLAEVIEDLDRSGRFWKRRQVDRAITMIEQGDADVLVVWKWSRVTRNRLDWAVAVDRVESAGGRLDSATEPIDVSTSAGRLQRGILSEFAAFESDRIGDVWREVHARRVRNGRPINGKNRFGYVYDRGEQLHRPDERTGPLLATLYRRYVAGESFHALSQWLNSERVDTAIGYVTPMEGRRVWGVTTLRRVLDSGFGAGLITVNGRHLDGVHEPVIDRPLWRQYQAARAVRRGAGRGERSAHLFTGLIRCVAPLADGSPCGGPMGGGESRPGQPHYRCTRSMRDRDRHAGGTVAEKRVSDHVKEVLAEIAAEVDVTGQRAVSARPTRAASDRTADATAREIDGLERELVTLTRQLGRQLIPEAAYRMSRADIEAEIEALTARHAREVLTVRQVDAGPVAKRALADWNDGALATSELREMLRGLIDVVEVRPGRPRAEITVIPKWRPASR